MDVLEEVPGIRAGTADARIRDIGRDDITVFAFEPGAIVGGVYTPPTVAPGSKANTAMSSRPLSRILASAVPNLIPGTSSSTPITGKLTDT